MPIRRLDFRGRNLQKAEYASLLPRSSVNPETVLPEVNELVDRLKKHGTDEIIKQVYQFDNVKLSRLRVSAEACERAYSQLSPTLNLAINTAIQRLRLVAQETKPEPKTVAPANNASIDVRYVPVERAAVYAPGGQAAYPSSLIMGVVPAQIAGVENIAVFSPVQAQTELPDINVLAAAHALGIKDVFAIGGVAAVYAAAYGIREEGYRPADILVGPGNVYTTAAKRLLSQNIGIDSEAGPTEILIIADNTANATYVAADLISQAEHDYNAAAVCVTTSPRLADEIAAQLEKSIGQEPNRERITASLSGKQSAIVLVDNLQHAIEVSNAWGPEHLSIQTEDPAYVAESTHNAGAIFIGAFSPVSLGDYLAGSNHVLPTSNQSRHSSGLSVETFLKRQEIVHYSNSALGSVSALVEDFADAEQLPAHGRAVRVRTRRFSV